MKKIFLIAIILIISVICSSYQKSDKDCQITINGATFPLYGKVKVVNIGEDIKVKVVNIAEDIKVKVVKIAPDNCGLWQYVNIGEDIKIKFVDIGEDIKVKFVDIGEGIRH
jgi:hypothetical protein